MRNHPSIHSLFFRVSVLTAATIAAALPALGTADFQEKVTFPTDIDGGGMFPFTRPASLGYQKIASGVFTPPLDPDQFDVLARYDDDGVSTGAVQMITDPNTRLESLFGVANNLAQFWAGYVHSDGYVDVGLFKFLDYSAVFEKRIPLVADPNGVSMANHGDTFSVVQRTNLGQNMLIAVFDNTTGDTLFVKDATSNRFIMETPFVATQTASLQRLPDKSGYVLVVQNNALNIETFMNETRMILVFLDNSGTVTATSCILLPPNALASATICSDNSVLVHALETVIEGTEQVTISYRNHLFSIKSDGQLKWSTILTGAFLTLAKTEAPNGDIYLTGSQFAGEEMSTTDGVIVRLSPTDGTLLSQVKIDCDPSDLLSIGGASSSAVYVTDNHSDGISEEQTVTLMKLSPDLSSVSVAREYSRKVKFGQAFFDGRDPEVVFTANEGTDMITAISLDENLADNLTCSLFTDVEKTLADPGIAEEAAEITPYSIIIDCTEGEVECVTPAFEFAAPQYIPENVCKGVVVEDAISVDPDTVNFGAEGGTEEVDVTANTDWVLNSTLATWLALLPENGTAGTTSLSVTAEANTSMSPRSTEVTLTAGTASTTLTVNQAATVDVNDPLLGGTPVEGLPGWFFSEWFGFYNTDLAPWLFHAEHGFIFFVAGATSDDMFFYDDAMVAWWWTNVTIYPFLFVFDPPVDLGGIDIAAEWLFYFTGSTNPRSFGIATGPFTNQFLSFGPLMQ